MSRSYESLPAPFEYPVVGSALQRITNPLHFFEEVSKKGDAVRFHIFNHPRLMFNHPDLVHEVLVTKQNSFHKESNLKSTAALIGNSVLINEGEEHAHQRRLIQPAFHHGRIAGYAQVMADMVAEWTSAQSAGNEIDIAAEMNALTLKIVYTTLFGSAAGPETADARKALALLIEGFNRMFIPFWKLLDKLPTEANTERHHALELLNKTIYDLIAKRRAENRDHGDLLSMLLAAEDAESPQKHLSDSEVRDQVMTIFIAGHETTANALAWTWYLLSRHDEARRKMKAEIDAVLGPDRAPTLEDTMKLPYTTAVFSEGMRLYPPIWAIGRQAIEDVVIGDYEVPKDMVVVMCQYSMQRDERFWPKPLEFLPERWLDEAEQKTRPKFAYFPFGGGARVCAGESFAWGEAVILLATIARKWKFEPTGEEPIPQPVLTLRSQHGIKLITREA